MNAYQRYLKMKALSEFWEGLSDSDKQMLANSCKISKDENENIIQKLDVIEKKVDKNKYSFATDLGANIAGNAVYEGAVWIIKHLFSRI